MEEPQYCKLQYKSLSSSVNPAFWNELTRRKLHEYKLATDLVPVSGFFQPGNSRMALDWSGFDESPKIPPSHLSMNGTLLNVNTLSDFKKADFKQLANDAGAKIWQSIVSGDVLQKPSQLFHFFVLTFADMKCHQFHHWFCFPAIVAQGVEHTATALEPASTVCSTLQAEQLDEACRDVEGDYESEHCFLYYPDPDGARIAPLSQLGCATPDAVVVLADPCSLEAHPGWALRNTLEMLRCHWTASDSVKIMLWRGGVDKSRMVTVKLGGQCKAELSDWNHKVVGWEHNTKDKLAPRKVRALHPPSAQNLLALRARLI